MEISGFSLVKCTCWIGKEFSQFSIEAHIKHLVFSSEDLASSLACWDSRRFFFFFYPRTLLYGWHGLQSSEKIITWYYARHSCQSWLHSIRNASIEFDKQNGGRKKKRGAPYTARLCPEALFSQRLTKGADKSSFQDTEYDWRLWYDGVDSFGFV